MFCEGVLAQTLAQRSDEQMRAKLAQTFAQILREWCAAPFLSEGRSASCQPELPPGIKVLSLPFSSRRRPGSAFDAG
jgi:hypothetical protein